MMMEQRKVFVGGIPRSGVGAGDLRAHFARYGEVVDAVVMTYPDTGLGRGFGFVEFADEDAVIRALHPGERDNHVLNSCRVDVRRAQRRYNQTQATLPVVDPKKIFVGGLRDNMTKDDLTDFFGKFGTITDAVVMYDRITKRPRGFGFLTFHSQEAVDKVLENRFHHLNGIKVETKVAEPRGSSRYQHGYYPETFNGGYMSPANIYAEMGSPHNVPYLFHNGSYFYPAFQYVYPPQGHVSYSYMMDQASTSNDMGMMPVQRSPIHYANYYGSPALNGDWQVNGISAPTGVKKSDIPITDPRKSP